MFCPKIFLKGNFEWENNKEEKSLFFQKNLSLKFIWAKAQQNQ